jgi:hypothetical protein
MIRGLEVDDCQYFGLQQMEQADRERRGKTNVDEFGTGTKQMVLEV